MLTLYALACPLMALAIFRHHTYRKRRQARLRSNRAALAAYLETLQ